MANRGLAGGWAVDFYAGAVTRGNGDIDVAVWARDAEARGSLLEEAGWRHGPAPDEDGGTGYTRRGVRVDDAAKDRADSHVLSRLPPLARPQARDTPERLPSGRSSSPAAG